MRLKTSFGKKMLSLIVSVVIVSSPLSLTAYAANDTKGHWAEKTIQKWQGKGFVNGYSDGSFKPNKPISRAEFIHMLNEALNLTEKEEIDFSDVKDTDWFYEDVQKAVGKKYTKGFPDKTFKPNANITRMETAVLISKALDLEKGEALDFVDLNSIPIWAQDSISAVISKGYMNGYTDKTFQGNKKLTRAEAISTLDRIIEDDYEEPDTDEKVFLIDKSGITIEDKTIDGNVIVSEDVGSGDLRFQNVDIKGDLTVRGSGLIYLTETSIYGKLVIDKDNVIIKIGNDTKIKNIDVLKSCELYKIGDDFKIEKINVMGKNIPCLKTDCDAEKLTISERAHIIINSTVENAEVLSGASGTVIEILSDGKIETLKVNAQTKLSGNGTIENLEGDINNIKYDSKLNIVNLKAEDEKDIKTNNSKAQDKVKDSKKVKDK